MMQKRHYVTIKGTKDGLVFQLDDRCPYEELLEELKEKLSSNHYQDKEGRLTKVRVDSGFRYLQLEEKEEIEHIITTGRNLAVEQFCSHVMTKEEADDMIKEAQTVTLTKIIRSGQVIKVEGDVILIGDVNPGGTIMATGNVYVLGALRGIAHAGFQGNKGAVIIASYMDPVQLKIANEIRQFQNEEGDENELTMVSAFIQNGTIELGRVQQLVQSHPQLQKHENQLLL